MKKRLLFITQVYPSAATGTTVKTRHTIEYLLKEGFIVDVCCIHYEKMVKNEFKAKNLKIYITPKGSIFSKVSFSYLLRVFNLLFSIVPLRVKKMYDAHLADSAERLQKKYDYEAVLYDGFSTLQYLKEKSSKNIYIDDEDITDLLKKRMNSVGNIFLRLFLFTEYVKCLIYERLVLKKVDQIWAIAPNTLKRLKTLSSAKISLMPTVVPDERESAFQIKSKDLVFTGLLSWMENVNGLKWFLDNFWSDLRKKFPSLTLHVVGQMAEKDLVVYLSRFEGVILHGYVADLADIYKKSAVAIAPILINSGIKVKILTYLSYGLPVVSTRQATWGLSSHNGIEVASEKNFGKAVIKLLSNSQLRKKLSKEGQKNIKKNHSETALRNFFVKAQFFKDES